MTGRRYAELRSTEIWQKFGAASAAVITAPRRGVPIVHADISSTLRDMARFGLSFTPTGRVGKHPLISACYLDDLQKRGRLELSRAVLGKESGCVDGDFFKGLFGR